MPTSSGQDAAPESQSEEEKMAALEGRLATIEQSLGEIRLRNSRVEVDKAWETSFCRIAAISALTWLLISLVFRTIGVERFFVNAIIPTVGYLLSTQSLPVIKRWWVERHFGANR